MGSEGGWGPRKDGAGGVRSAPGVGCRVRGGGPGWAVSGQQAGVGGKEGPGTGEEGKLQGAGVGKASGSGEKAAPCLRASDQPAAPGKAGGLRGGRGGRGRLSGTTSGRSPQPACLPAFRSPAACPGHVCVEELGLTGRPRLARTASISSLLQQP